MLIKFKVVRQACCAADDQLNSLEAEFEISPDASFAELVTQIIRSGFLQFSSTHTCLFGEIEGSCVVKIDASSIKAPVFYIDQQRAAFSIVGNKTLYFNFRQV